MISAQPATHSTQAREIMERFRALNQAGTAIVQATHSEDRCVVWLPSDPLARRLDCRR